MRICMHCAEASPSKEGVISGGVQNNTLRLIKTIDSMGISTTLVTSDRKYTETSEITNDFMPPWVDIQPLLINADYSSLRFGMKYFIKTVAKMRYVSKRANIDVIHGHSGILALAIITGLSSRFTGIPAVHTLCCPVKKQGILCRYFLKNIKKIIATSNCVRVSLERAGIPNNKIEVIPPIVDFSRFKPGAGKEIRDTLNIPDEFVILYLGNLGKTKGVDIILDALNLVKSQYPNIKLLSGIELSHTGKDSGRKQIMTKIKNLNLDRNIEEFGLISNVEEAMDIADVYVYPIRDTFGVMDYPLSILESMAVGTPVITTRVGGIPEIIENYVNGIMIKPNDSRELADKITYLIENPIERKKLSTNGMKFVNEKFNTDKIVSKIIDIYHEVIEG